MTPSEILLSAKQDIPFYFLGDYINNLKADGDFSLAGTEESMLSSAIGFYSSNGNPNKTASVPVGTFEEDAYFDIDFPDEFSRVIQIRDRNLQSVPHEVNEDTSKITVSVGPLFITPYEIKFQYALEDYFDYSVDESGVVTVNTDKDIDRTISTLIKNLVKAKLNDYNKKISEVSRSVQMVLPTSDNQGEKALAEDEIRGQVRIQPSLMSF